MIEKEIVLEVKNLKKLFSGRSQAYVKSGR